MKKLLALSGLLLASASVYAVEQPYLGIGYTQTSYEITGGSDASPTVAQIRFGSDITKHLGLEARAAFGVDGDKYTFASASYDLNVTGIYTLSVVGRIPFATNASLYAHAGYSYAQLSADSADPLTFPNQENNDDGFSYGAGIVLPAWRHYHLEFDYTNYFDNDDYTFGGVSVGIRRYL